MRLVVIPRSTDLKVIVDPDGKVKEKTGSFLIPGIYDNWPEAREKGFTEIDIAGETLRALLVEISNKLNRGGVDLGPICSRTNDVKQSYDVFVNEKNYVLAPQGIDTILHSGDEVKIIEDTTGHC